MISIARTLGAPERVPAGSTARRASIGPISSRRRPETFETMCMTVEYCSTAMNESTWTVPKSQTRPRSLRPRSTSMTCSARSFSSARSPAASAVSSAGVAPRRRVPAMGRVDTSRPVTVSSGSGLAPATWKSRKSRKYMYGDGLTTRRPR